MLIEKAEADEKVQKGWVRSWLAFHVVATNEEITNKSIEDMMERLDKDGRVNLYKKSFSDVKKVQNPTKNIKEALGKTAEAEIITKNFEDLIQIAVEFGPSAVEILEPKKIELSIGEGQAIVNLLSQVMHQFAAAGLGGIVFVRKDQKPQ
jgi:hypothetical protein